METCFVKLSDCSEYAKTSDSKFEDIKISNKTSSTFLQYLENTDICMTEKQFGKKLYFSERKCINADKAIEEAAEKAEETVEAKAKP